MSRTVLADLEVLPLLHGTAAFAAQPWNAGVSPALISQTVRRLEEQLGVELLRRTTRSVALSSAGEQLLQPLASALEEIRTAVERVDAQRATPMGRLRINAPAPIAQFLLAPLVTEFLHMHPQIEMEIVAESAKIDIVQAGFDAGVRFDADLQQDAVAVPIGPPQRYAVVASLGTCSNMRRQKLPRGCDYTHASADASRAVALFEWVFRKKGRQVRVSPDGPLTVNDAVIAVQAAVAGAGIAYVHEQYARREIEAGALVRLLEDWSPGLGQPFLYFPRQRHVPAALRAFIDFARVHRMADA